MVEIIRDRKRFIKFLDLKNGEVFEIINHIDYKDKVFLKLLSSDGDKYNIVDLKNGEQSRIQDHIQVKPINAQLVEY